ncbi:hypothetical protein [Pseudoduganella umbonata]|uniref:Uncharacterized protein n=1 Tax=Pseudoduganella umbonata TaxID=864828 RepID=A0A4P8HQ38_9BURK|nr:hypothetical protein [Pseudoduganella umbonata]MBB3221281.1 hypothetical protein [Pseudoduganella umbonata]QCP10455.1 hypothetical protein FCL38_08455 [Pseudoduganella umbonata]
MIMRTAFLLRVMCPLLSFWPSLAVGTEAAPDRASSAFVEMVNVHAIKMDMLCGERQVRTKEGHAVAAGRCLSQSASVDESEPGAEHTCIVRIATALAPKFQQYAALHREILRSPLPGEVYRFNHPRTPADRDVFELNEETCMIRRYLGTSRGFKPPISVATTNLLVQYATEAEAGGEELLVDLYDNKPRRRVQLQPVTPEYENRTHHLELTKPPSESSPLASGRILITYQNKKIAEWDRRLNLSILQNMPDLKNGSVRLHHPHATEDLITLRAGSKIFFPVGATLTIRKPTLANTGKRSPATLLKDAVSISRVGGEQKPLFQQTAKGHIRWGQSPTNFEVQIVEALRTVGSNVAARVTLSLDPGISKELFGLLDDSIKQLRKELTSDKSGKRAMGSSRPLYGSITMIDAWNGEVIALAGYPESPAPRAYTNGDYRAVPVREEGLKRRVIGSVAKVPLAFAVIAGRPELRNMTLSNYQKNSIDTVLGYALTPPIETLRPNNCAPEVVFRCFIAFSINKYAVNLLALGAVKKDTPLTGGQDPEVKIAGQAVLSPPPGYLFSSNVFGGDLETLPWAQQAVRMFDLGVHFEDADPPAHHEYMWRQALLKPPRSAEPLYLIAPEQENFRLNLANNFRSDYLNLILGGGDSRWSSVKVAETYARLVYGSLVKATFVKPGKPEGKLFDNNDPAMAQAHGELLAGLRDTVVIGTGVSKSGIKKLSDVKRAWNNKASESNLTIEMYAKTGTPAVAALPNSQWTERISGLIKAKIIRVRPRDDPAEGNDFYYMDKVIDGNLVAAQGSRAATTAGHAALTTRTLQFFADFNASSIDDQQEKCAITGEEVVCKDAEERTLGPAAGRNLALVIEVRRSGKFCHAVSLAYSHSFRSEKVWWKMIGDSLQLDGSIARHVWSRALKACDE